MTSHSVSWHVRAIAGMLLLWTLYYNVLGFATSSFPKSAISHLRGCESRSVVHGGFQTTQSGKTRAVFASPLIGVVGLVASVGAASAAAAKVPRKVTSRIEWYRKVKRVGTDAIFDVTIPKPLGLKIENFPQKDKEGAGVSKIQPNGNTDKVNRRVCVDDEPGAGMWVLEGDRIMAVNGVDTEDGDIDKIVGEIMGNDGPEVTLTLMRNTRKGPIRIVMMPEGYMCTVRRNSRLSAAAEMAAGRDLKYGCIDGWCGTCWHRERTTNGIFKPCCDVLTGDWDNVMPLVITPKPERAGDSTLLNPRGV
eukprot:CAMPEP_0172727352 /NCGR_PEP_ID=MMETSP1074-20121228/91628_1 /TAXON_ID=2916 /ORGANISM="Ceratium fusus, Strain PA161109" /LENGTH=305 /DNA_ID=CAMNT_0013554489 /DNA_START=43 /DNA_END=960 /DNA_ORIENTATION=+